MKHTLFAGFFFIVIFAGFTQAAFGFKNIVVSRHSSQMVSYNKSEGRDTLINDAIKNTFLKAKFKNIATGELQTIDVKKTKYTLFVFWGSWSARSREPIIREVWPAYKNLESKGVSLIGVSIDKNIEVAKKSILKDKTGLPQFLDNDNTFTLLQRNSVPAYILYNREKNTLETFIRFSDVLNRI